MNLSQQDRKTIIEGIILSDCRYLEKLADRKVVLLLELQILEGSIRKKAQEIQCMQGLLGSGEPIEADSVGLVPHLKGQLYYAG